MVASKALAASLLVMAVLSSEALAHSKRVNLDDDIDIEEDAQVLKSGNVAPKPFKVDKHTLEYRFEGDSKWASRGAVDV